VIRKRIASSSEADVLRALAAGRPTEDDLAALFSPAAAAHVERLAQLSKAVTERRFGKVIQLYAPLYLSNACVNHCTYCGFAANLDIPRVTLTPEDVLREADLLHEEGFRHILLVSGEDPRAVTMPYLLEVVAGLRAKFASIAIEIQPLKVADYRRLAECGVDGLALYQEVYEPAGYARYHLAGPKRRYGSRLDAIEAGGEAGFRSLGIGSLLGLSDWRLEAYLVALHGRYLTQRFWQSRISVSFPRLQGCAHEDFQPEAQVTDPEFVQMLCAMRLLLPDAELVVSTREPASLRDNLIGLGVTRMSAGSRTNPGGYGLREWHEGEQFDIGDQRPPAIIARVIAEKGYEAVWKDFDRSFIP